MRRRVGLGIGLGLFLAGGLAVTRANAQTPSNDPLDRRLSGKFDHLDLGGVLTRLRSIYGIPLAFSPDAVPPGKVISLAFEEQSVGQILDQVLEGSGLRVVRIAGGSIVVAPGFASPQSLVAAPRSPTPNLASGVRQLDQIVVMGTPAAGGQERDNPNAVSVVRAADLKRYHFSRTADLFRTALPGVVLWDQGPSGPPAEIAAVRGASSFTARGLKTYIDGVEVASSALVTLIDPRSIERIEVIRGPQGAALYGSDAINGVIQIITQKGSFGETEKFQASGNVAAGPFDQQALSSPMLRQNYAGGITWGGARATLAGSGTMGRVGTASNSPFTKNWSAQAGGQLALGNLLLSGSARGGQVNFSEDLLTSTPLPGTAPIAQPGAAEVAVGTIGLTAVHQLSGTVVQSLVLGYDRADGALGSRRAAIASYRLPLDATHETSSRTSVRYSIAKSTEFRSGMALTTTAGLEYSRLSYTRGAWDDYRTRGYAALYEDAVRNSGAFAQGKLRAGPFLINGGARAEWSSSVGTSVGTAWAPSLGASWTRPVGDLALRLRGGWGKGLRPPEPGMSRAMATTKVTQQANPNLAPESQAGYELGADLYAGTDGYARVSYFDQRARDLIQGVVLPTVAAAKPRYQFQNVGAIRNNGWEIEGGLRFGSIGVDASFYATNSVVQQIAPTYSGILRVGDQLPEVPKSSGSLRLSYLGRRMQLAVGATYLGAWTGQDFLEIAKVSASQAPIRASQRDFLIRYPSLLKPYVNLSFDLARQFTGYLNIDNLTRSDRFERHNGNPPAGRSLLIGLEVRP